MGGSSPSSKLALSKNFEQILHYEKLFNAPGTSLKCKSGQFVLNLAPGHWIYIFSLQCRLTRLYTTSKLWSTNLIKGFQYSQGEKVGGGGGDWFHGVFPVSLSISVSSISPQNFRGDNLNRTHLYAQDAVHTSHAMYVQVEFWRDMPINRFLLYLSFDPTLSKYAKLLYCYSLYRNLSKPWWVPYMKEVWLL